jgi:hypothetical protein
MEFTEELFSTDKFQLRIRRKGNVAQFSKKGAFGTSSSSTSIASYSSLKSGSHTYDLTVSDQVLVSMKQFYYLVGTNGKYTLIKNVKTFTKHFPAYRAQIEGFVRGQNTRFDNSDDLKALLEYCSKLK